MATEMRPDLENDVTAFSGEVLMEQEELGLSEHRLFALDETGIVSGGIPNCTFVDPITLDRFVVETAPRRRDTITLAVLKTVI